MGETLACRLCLSTNTKLYNMYKYTLDTVFNKLTGLEMTASDGLPPYTCSVCSTLLVKSTKFKQMCENSQNLLKLAYEQRVLSTVYIRNLKITSPFSLSNKFYEPIDHQQNIKEELWLWDIQDNNKVKETESSDEEPLSSKIRKSELNIQVKDEEVYDNDDYGKDNEFLNNDDDFLNKDDEFLNGRDDDFPNGEVDEIVLTKEEQIAEVQSRKTSTNYLNSFYKCDHCYKGFITDATYKNHMATHDPSAGAHECEICHIRVRAPRALRAHAVTSHERKFVCKLCNHVAKSRHRAKEHSKWHSGHTFVCKFCGATFNKSTSHLTHIRLHHPSKHTCFVCGESFIGETGLNMHKKKAHRDVTNSEPGIDNRCAHCDVQFHTVEALKRHTNETDIPCDPNLRPCAQCGESCNTEEDLKEHLKQHSKDEPVKCEACNRIFAHERSFSVHYQRVHLRARGKKERGKRTAAPVVCEICGRKCISNASLRYHQRTHTGERPYQCTECPKRFSIAQRLQIHQRTHTGERPYKCSFCPKAFKHKAALNRHDRVHTGAKPYSCTHCGKTFSQSNSMKVHIRTVHLKLPAPYRARRTAVE